MNKISVIMPVYNCEKFLKHTVRSVLEQTYENWELIIVDDASTDNSLLEARYYEAEDDRIKVFAMPQNSGVSACRNFALERADGDYVAFLDSDDLWSKYKLEKQLVFMQRHDAALSHTSYAFMNERGEVMKNGKVNVDVDVDLPRYMKTTQIGMSSVMIDRRKIPDVVFPKDRELCEDARVWMKFMREGHKFYGLNEVLLLYRVRDGQLSRNKVKMAQNTLRRYWNEKDLPAYKRLAYFLHYACNGIEKRICPAEFDASSVLESFNCNKGR